jgi:hypothetical protein
MVCDSALGQPKPLCQIHRAGLHFIVPLKTSTAFQERYLTDVGLITVTVGQDAGGKPTIVWQRDEHAIAHAARTDGLYALATNLPGKLTAGKILRLYKEQEVVERRHRDLKQTLKVRPIFLHNDDRIYALISIIGIALLIFGLLETQLRQALDADDHQDKRLPLLPESRLSKPTGANILSAFQGLDLTYTHRGTELDPLTPTQQRILDLLAIQPPWPQRDR